MEIYHRRAEFLAQGKDYYVIEFKPRSGVVVVRQREVLLVSQYRLLLNETSWELPGGAVEKGESPDEAVARECLEETGIRPLNLSLLTTSYPGLDNVDNRTTIFSAANFEVCQDFVPNPLEVNDIRWLPLDEALNMVRQGKILDAMTIMGLLSFCLFQMSNALQAGRP
jgi:8-oxo-dGTP pyrophosphatase MutT (NUDIX family)